MARLSRAARKKHASEMMIAIVLGLALIGLISVAVYLYTHHDKAPDSATLCPAAGPLGHYVVLIDNTDPYNFMQRQAFVEGMRSLVEGQVPEGNLLSIYVLGSNFTENAKPVFEKCNPGQGEGKSDLTANLERIKKRFDDDFMKPVLAISESVLIDKQSDRSPIFEMFQIASINGFRAQKIAGERVLIVFSDMLPNTSEFSMFKGLPEFKKFMDSTYGRKSQTDFEGVKVKINYLLNYPKLQNRNQLSFWEAYFEKAGAKIVSVKTLEG